MVVVIVMVIVMVRVIVVVIVIDLDGERLPRGSCAGRKQLGRGRLGKAVSGLCWKKNYHYCQHHHGIIYGSTHLKRKVGFLHWFHPQTNMLLNSCWGLCWSTTRNSSFQYLKRGEGEDE